MKDKCRRYLSNQEYRQYAQQLYEEIADAYKYLKQHKPSIGNFGEHILRSFLNKILPDGIRATQGFVHGITIRDYGKIEEETFSSQCDIIVYQESNNDIIWSFGDIDIVSADAVISVIEVKTTVQRKTFQSTLKAFEILSSMGCNNNYLFVYNEIAPATLCDYFFKKDDSPSVMAASNEGLFDHGSQYNLPLAICNLQSNYCLCQDYVVDEQRDKYGYNAYKCTDRDGTLAALQIFIGSLLEQCIKSEHYSDDIYMDISSFDCLNVIYSIGLWDL